MVKTGKQGRTAVRSSIAELEKARYIHRQVVRNEAGRITGTEYLVYEQAVSKLKGSCEMATPSMDATREECSNLSSEKPLEQDTNSQVKTATGDEVQCLKTCPTGNDPLINTNIEQTLRETTTTTQNLDPEPVVEVLKEAPSSYPDSQV